MHLFQCCFTLVICLLLPKHPRLSPSGASFSLVNLQGWQASLTIITQLSESRLYLHSHSKLPKPTGLLIYHLKILVSPFRLHPPGIAALYHCLDTMTSLPEGMPSSSSSLLIEECSPSDTGSEIHTHSSHTIVFFRYRQWDIQR